MEKLLSPPAVQFKGSGWYVTDYARKAESGKSDAPDSGKDSAKPDGKADSKKTENKTETKSKEVKPHH